MKRKDVVMSLYCGYGKSGTEYKKKLAAHALRHQLTTGRYLRALASAEMAECERMEMEKVQRTQTTKLMRKMGVGKL